MLLFRKDNEKFHSFNKMRHFFLPHNHLITKKMAFVPTKAILLEKKAIL